MHRGIFKHVVLALHNFLPSFLHKRLLLLLKVFVEVSNFLGRQLKPFSLPLRVSGICSLHRQKTTQAWSLLHERYKFWHSINGEFSWTRRRVFWIILSVPYALLQLLHLVSGVGVKNKVAFLNSESIWLLETAVASKNHTLCHRKYCCARIYVAEGERFNVPSRLVLVVFHKFIILIVVN